VGLAFTSSVPLLMLPPPSATSVPATANGPLASLPENVNAYVPLRLELLKFPVGVAPLWELPHPIAKARRASNVIAKDKNVNRIVIT
jgi:hypothetical protein